MNNYLSYEDIRASAPAAFALEKGQGLSDRYSFISTLEVIQRLADRDWFPVQAYQHITRRVKDPSHSTHVITFRKLHPLESLEVGDLIPQVMFINDHAGRKSAELASGFEKLACKNGLVVATGIAEEAFRQVHKGLLADQAVTDALDRAREALEAAMAQVEAWKQIKLNLIEELAFAREALQLRNPGTHGHAYPLLQRRRLQDAEGSLWNVFNVVQENLLRGGVPGVFNRRKLRGVRGISPWQRINQGLWELASRFGRKNHGT